MTEDKVLDVSGVLPETVTLRISADRVISNISTDIRPLIIAQAHDWLKAYIDMSNNPKEFGEAFDEEVGWNLAQTICGEDIHGIGTRALVRILSFFRDTAWEATPKPSSSSPSELPENSTEESHSENSLEAVAS